MSKSIPSILLFLWFSIATCKIENEDVNITFRTELPKEYIGKNGTIVISAEPSDKFDRDTSKQICFKSKITNGKDTYPVDCGFWKSSSEGKYFYAFCNIYDTNIPSGNYSFDFSGISKFRYQYYDINIGAFKGFNFVKLAQDYIDIYAPAQEIYIEEGKYYYYFKFKLVSYNQECIFLENHLILDCHPNGDELVCSKTKNELERVLYAKEAKYDVLYSSDRERVNILPLVGSITIIDNIAKKTDVFIKITKLKESVAEDGTFVAYETNVTNIDEVYSISDSVKLEFENEKGETARSECIIKKDDGMPLLVLCNPRLDGISWLKEIKEEKIFRESSIKYNFRIQPVKNEEKIRCKRDIGTFVYSRYPNVLDFTQKDSLFVEYFTNNPEYFKGITFNQDKGDLSCEIRHDVNVRCTIPKSHFDGKKTGYYYTKHTNHLNSKSTYYIIDPIKVILNSSSSGFFYSVSLYYLLLFILIMF